MWVVNIMAGELGQVLAAFDTREEANIFAKETSEKYVVESCEIKYSEKECCETCKHIDKGMQFDSCLNKIWSGSSECYSCHFDIKKMKCDEWEAR